MARAINGITGSGSVDTYQLSLLQSLTVDCISFVLTTDATAVTRAPQVVYRNPDRTVIATIPDWNDVGATAVVGYTFARGLNPFACVVETGGQVQHDLPFTELEQSCIIELRSVDTTGAVVPGDAFGAVVLWVEDGTEDVGDVVPLYTSERVTAPA